MSAPSGGIDIRLPDGSVRSVPNGTTAGEVLQAWRPKEAREFLAARFDDALVDLSQPLRHAGALTPLTFRDREGRDVLQHSSAHVVAKAVTEVVPGALPTAGPPTEDGFHYDFDVRPLTPDDQAKIEAAIAATIKAGEKFERIEVSREEANRLCAANPHKLGYIREIPEGETVSLYRTGSFLDLCRGPHVPDTHWLRGLHLLGISAVSADGTAAGPSRQRIRGVGFPTREEL
ncbi:MAG TPA: threonine--tRNA ligase, partial [Thermoplasmata archaeon]|nr:threonine--tRNA ligase [Thermoplasmata archaeon]